MVDSVADKTGFAIFGSLTPVDGDQLNTVALLYVLALKEPPLQMVVSLCAVRFILFITLTDTLGVEVQPLPSIMVAV
ncbi:MAG: hypothetical protein ABI402_08490 [Ferruginibacter sp.]